MRLPRREDLFGFREVARGPDNEETVVQRQLDQVYDQLPVVEDERPVRVDQPRFPVTLDDGLPFENGLPLRRMILVVGKDSADLRVRNGRQP